MKRYLDDWVRQDLSKKLVVLTGPRQVGKTTLSRQLVDEFAGAQYLNYDVAAHRAVMMEIGRATRLNSSHSAKSRMPSSA